MKIINKEEDNPSLEDEAFTNYLDEINTKESKSLERIWDHCKIMDISASHFIDKQFLFMMFYIAFVIVILEKWIV